ncbi:hypothetical protein CgunFtcFv8_026096 [Champsocephalus gunnari]|uniref:Uncharacterized protein n=1 Tax=Champsocephalus gunnari TaxID=52237 RepID=A0AAN8CBQ6_CHAGU|nr:hypothetical protein CgunFtcFv8_026096 [Champsocephalus gunnari]
MIKYSDSRKNHSSHAQTEHTLELHNHPDPWGNHNRHAISFHIEKGQRHVSLWSIVWRIREVLQAAFQTTTGLLLSACPRTPEIRLFSRPTLGWKSHCLWL